MKSNCCNSELIVINNNKICTKCKRSIQQVETDRLTSSMLTYKSEVVSLTGKLQTATRKIKLLNEYIDRLEKYYKPKKDLHKNMEGVN